MNINGIGKTRYPDMGYKKIAPNLWRIIFEGQAIGPLYKTKAELLADLTNQAEISGFEQ